MYELLKVTGIGEVKDNGKGLRYITLTFRPLMLLPSGTEVLSNQKEKSRTLFGANGDFKADPLFDDAVAGKVKRDTLVEGTINVYETTPYQPEGFQKQVTSFTCVVFKGENGVTFANRQLKANYACVVSSDSGMLTAPEQLERPTTIEVRHTTTVE